MSKNETNNAGQTKCNIYENDRSNELNVLRIKHQWEK